ncbi:MAG: DUF2267 domain-containing protein [Chromatocurvus sp.]
MPYEYQRATDDFYSFLVDVRNEADLWSTHVAYTMTQGVFQTFSRRLSLHQAITFANALPVGLRALFVSDWPVDEALRPFASLQAMNAEVRELRGRHNFSPPDSIQIVARVLHRHVEPQILRHALRNMPREGLAFWFPEH